MSVDFPRAWEISRAVAPEGHDPECSCAQTNGALLCDCQILFGHPEYLDDVMQTSGGVVFDADEWRREWEARR